MELMRCMVEVPLILDKAMREDISSSTASPAQAQTSTESSGNGTSAGQGQLERRGILGVRTKGMLVLTCRMLERAESWTGGSTASASGSASWEDDESDPPPELETKDSEDLSDGRERTQDPQAHP